LQLSDTDVDVEILNSKCCGTHVACLLCLVTVADIFSAMLICKSVHFSLSVQFEAKPVTALKLIHCVQKKMRQKCFFCNIYYKTLAILTKFGTLFPEYICCKI